MEYVGCGGKFITNKQKYPLFSGVIVGFLVSQEIAAKTSKEEY
jgi:hypothetical protein